MTVIYALTMLVSMAFVVWFVTAAVKQYRAKEKSKRLLTPMRRATLGVLLAVFAIFVPVYIFSESISGGTAVLRVLFLAGHNTMRVFVLDGEFTIINIAVKELPPVLDALYSGYAALLYVAAPLLTAGFILTLFKGLVDKFRFEKLGHHGKTFIFSELNECSIALAERIFRREEGNKPTFVFAEVFEKNEEAD
jgi:hypothetical protein